MTDEAGALVAETVYYSYGTPRHEYRSERILFRRCHNSGMSRGEPYGLSALLSWGGSDPSGSYAYLAQEHSSGQLASPAKARSIATMVVRVVERLLLFQMQQSLAWFPRSWTAHEVYFSPLLKPMNSLECSDASATSRPAAATTPRTSVRSSPTNGSTWNEAIDLYICRHRSQPQILMRNRSSAQKSSLMKIITQG